MQLARDLKGEVVSVDSVQVIIRSSCGGLLWKYMKVCRGRRMAKSKEDEMAVLFLEIK